ncbi:MAG: hypothetical protein AAFW83_10430 [Pseudomonadota bacterium]
MTFFKNRLQEASTWAGLPMIMVGITSLLGMGQRKAEIATQVGEQIGGAVASGLPWWQGALIAGTGLVMSVGREAGSPDKPLPPTVGGGQ